jgi:hypothetical protein
MTGTPLIYSRRAASMRNICPAGVLRRDPIRLDFSLMHFTDRSEFTASPLCGKKQITGNSRKERKERKPRRRARALLTLFKNLFLCVLRPWPTTCPTKLWYYRDANQSNCAAAHAKLTTSQFFEVLSTICHLSFAEGVGTVNNLTDIRQRRQDTKKRFLKQKVAKEAKTD